MAPTERSKLAARALLAPPLVAACLAISAAQALVGRATPDAADANHIVMVLASERGKAGFCSGVVLAPDVVLTAAHCVPLGADLRIHFRDETGAPILLGVTDVARHPLYQADAARRRRRSIDLALVRLATPLPARFSPTALDESAAVAVGDRFKLAGFGVSREGVETTAGVLRAGVLVVREPLSHILLWANDPTGRGLGACSGDSGAPILSLDGSRVVAIVDWATGTGAQTCGALTQATFVAPQREWINRTLALWRSG